MIGTIENEVCGGGKYSRASEGGNRAFAHEAFIHAMPCDFETKTDISISSSLHLL